MKIKSSKKIFTIAATFYMAALVCFLTAMKIYGEELGRIIDLWGSAIHFTPDLNIWHYLVLVNLCIAVSFTIAAIWLRK